MATAGALRSGDHAAAANVPYRVADRLRSVAHEKRHAARDPLLLGIRPVYAGADHTESDRTALVADILDVLVFTRIRDVDRRLRSRREPVSPDVAPLRYRLRRECSVPDRGAAHQPNAGCELRLCRKIQTPESQRHRCAGRVAGEAADYRAAGGTGDGVGDAAVGGVTAGGEVEGPGGGRFNAIALLIRGNAARVASAAAAITRAR